MMFLVNVDLNLADFAPKWDVWGKKLSSPSRA